MASVEAGALGMIGLKLGLSSASKSGGSSPWYLSLKTVEPKQECRCREVFMAALL